MFRRKQQQPQINEQTADRRSIFFEFLSNLAEEFDTLHRRYRFATLSDEAFSTLQMALVHTAREAQQYQLTRLYEAAVSLEMSIRDVQTDTGGLDHRFELKRAFDDFTSEAQRSILREEERLQNAGLVAGEDTVPVVLVVDTDPWAHKLVDRAVGQRCVVISAYNAHAAIETLRTTRPDLVVMDFNLPDMRGADLLSKLKSRPEIATVPVVVSSAEADDDAVVCGLVGGAIDFIPKGSQLSEVRRRLLETLDHGRLRLA